MNKLVIPLISKGRIRLRLLEEPDLPMTLKWRNQDHIRRWFIHSEILSIDQHQNWFDAYLQKDNDYLFIIEIFDIYRPVGQISLYNIDWASHCAEYGRLIIGEADAHGKGIAKEASRMLLHFAFSVLGLKEITLEVHKDNKPALTIYVACGFKEISKHGDLIKMVVDKNTFCFKSNIKKYSDEKCGYSTISQLRND